VVDFDDVQARVLGPCHLLLDHGLALGEQTFAQNQETLRMLGEQLVGSRCETLGDRGTPPPVLSGTLGGARNERPGGIKVAVFPWSPTSERLAEWLYRVGEELLSSERVHVTRTRVFEALHPVESAAEFSR